MSLVSASYTISLQTTCDNSCRDASLLLLGQLDDPTFSSVYCAQDTSDLPSFAYRLILPQLCLITVTLMFQPLQCGRCMLSYRIW